MGLAEIAFPYRTRSQFGLASSALVFIVLLIEIELLVLIGLLSYERGDPTVFLALQPTLFPTAALVSAAATAVFAWRARSWTRRRIEALREYTAGASAFGERLARSRPH